MDTLKRKSIFEDMPVPKAVLKLAVPTVLAQLVTLAYNLADTLFIGMLNNPNMVAAVSLSTPLFMILTSIANCFGVGGSSVISRALGVKDIRRAKSATTFCLYAGVGVAAVLAVICAFITEPLSLLLGASIDTLEYTKTYIFWIFVVGGTPCALANIFSHIVRSEGNSFIAGLGTAIGGIINIGLDPVFIFVLKWGVKGVAVATMISNICAVVFFAIYLIINRNKTIISLLPSALKHCKKLVCPVISIGAPAALNSILVSVAIALLNKLTSGYGDIPLAAMGIVKKIDMVPWSIMFGLTHGILPLIGYNYAAKNFKRMKSVIKLAFVMAIVINVITITLFEIFAPQLVTIFIKDEEVVRYGAEFIRIMCICVPFMSIGFLYNMTFQAMGKPVYSFAITVARQGVIFIPILFLMNYLAGLIGLMWAQVMSDFLFAALAFTLYQIFIRRNPAMKKLPEPAPKEKTEANR